MKTRNLLLVITLIVGTLATADPGKGTCEIRFDCTSTVHDFHGVVTAEPFAVDYGNDAMALNAEIDVKIAKMDTDNKKRDKDMRGMFDAVKFPIVHGSIHTSMAALTSGSVPMELSISGVRKSVEMKIAHRREKDGKVEFDATFPVSLKAYELKAPRVLFIRVGDQVMVTAHFALPAPLASTPGK